MRIIGILHSVKLVARAIEPPGESIFTTSGVFTVPKGIKQLKVFCVGAGSTGMCNNGGGGGGYTVTSSISCSPGDSIPVSIGGGTRAWLDDAGLGYAGSTSVGSISATGGLSAKGASVGNGGSGGGAGTGGFTGQAGSGGSDGSNGHTDSSGNGKGGSGQGSTTRAFGESNGTLYAGGGGDQAENIIHPMGEQAEEEMGREVTRHMPQLGRPVLVVGADQQVWTSSGLAGLDVLLYDGDNYRVASKK